MDTIILAGGFGTRLKTVMPDIPKTLAPINNRPFLDYLLDYLIQQNINKVIL
jgi:Nucleoside-diphosphate-sugar pyrophosphorylase involved in lipopolysaccharide biosynthesis/translation initiation factor 2B, gamma/epsilon subunits (eIF-2Bgamma/eIF-2Bepsilon)